MALGVDGVKVGCWTSAGTPTGVTVVLPPAGSLGAVAVRGAAPGTREAIALGPNGKMTVCHAVVLSGGSAFGLSTADGVMDWLEERGVGYPVGGEEQPLARVPIVGAAIVLDASVADRDARPGPDQGRAACDAASDQDPPEGAAGVGAGCTVAKVGGLDHAWRGGQGVAVRQAAGVTVGAVVANNAVGEIRAADGTWVARSRAPRDVPRWLTTSPGRREPEEEPGPHGTGDGAGDGSSDPGAARERSSGAPSTGPGNRDNTVIGCVVTDAVLTKSQAVRVADLAHSGIARAVHPAHTSFDGDALFCLATGQVQVAVDVVAALAAEAVAEACRRGVRAATSADGVPGLADAPDGVIPDAPPQ